MNAIVEFSLIPLVSRPMNSMAFADGAWEGRSRSQEEVMQGHRRPRERRRDRPQPPSARRVAAGQHRFLCRSSSTMSLTSRRRRFANSTPSHSPQMSWYSWDETLGVGVSLSDYIAACEQILQEEGLQVELHTNGTNIEGEWDTVMRAIKKCHIRVHEMGAPRISTSLKVGSRTDRPQTSAEKVRSVEEKMRRGDP